MNEKIKDGLHTEWYKNGKKKFEGTFKDGKPVGLVTNWFAACSEKLPLPPCMPTLIIIFSLYYR